jgi:hypothetical protein
MKSRPIQVAVVLVGHVGRHEHLDVLPDRLLLAVPEHFLRALVVLLDDTLAIDLGEMENALSATLTQRKIALIATNTMIMGLLPRSNICSTISKSRLDSVMS